MPRSGHAAELAEHDAGIYFTWLPGATGSVGCQRRPFPRSPAEGTRVLLAPRGAGQGTTRTPCPPPGLGAGTYGRRLPGRPDRPVPGASGSGSLLFPDLFQTLLPLPTAVSAPSHSSQWHFLCLINAVVFEAPLRAGLLHLPRDRQGKRAALPEPRVPAPSPAPFLPPVPSSSARPPAEPPRLRRHHAGPERDAPSPAAQPAPPPPGAGPLRPSRARGRGVTAASGAAGASGQGKPGPRLPPAR